MNTDPPSPRREGAPSPRRLAVLIVEDHTDTAYSLFRLLSIAAYDAHVVSCGEEALQIAKVHPPDVVLLDLHLPRMDGYEVAERLRRSIAPPPSIAAVTAYADEQHVARSLSAGFDRHFVKPVPFCDLSKYLNEQAKGRGRIALPDDTG